MTSHVGATGTGTTHPRTRTTTGGTGTSASPIATPLGSPVISNNNSQSPRQNHSLGNWLSSPKKIDRDGDNHWDPYPDSRTPRVQVPALWRLVRTRRRWVLVALVLTFILFRKNTTIPQLPLRSSNPSILLPQLPPGLQPMLRALGRSRPNPLDQYDKAVYDPKLNVPSWPTQVTANEKHTITFRCSHTDVTQLCPQSYRLLFQGPTMYSPTFAASRQIDSRTVEVEFTIRDPGHYTVHVWPEHDSCGQWSGSDNLWNKKLVGWEPYQLEVVGPSQRESHKQCAMGHVPPPTDGRWITKSFLDPGHATSDNSPHAWWLQPHFLPTSDQKWATRYSHFFTHTECKVPHHTVKEWIELVKPSNLVIFGDSVLRDFFCLILYPALDGPEGGACKFAKDLAYQTSDKMLDYQREDGGISKLRFRWLPKGEVETLEQQLSQLDEDPSHVLFGVALWLAKESVEIYEAKMTSALSTLTTLTPSSTRILVRGNAGSVQAIQCYDRIGGGRRQLEAMNSRLAEVVGSNPRLEYFDVYPVFNSHPASSSDGRHWGAVGKEGEVRPEVGAGEFAVMDQMFWKWMGY
ncbi:hypothetical protein T439DRAFT_376072 [Meredithblackwellia eburnea MCA 4105]